MRKLINNQRGFTLIEMMMVVALLGIVLSVFYNYLNFNFRFLNDRNKENDSYLQAKIAMQRLTGHLLSYQRLDIVDTGGGNYYIQGKSFKKGDGSVETEALFNNNVTDSSNNVIYYLEPLDPVTGIGQLKKSGNLIAGNIRILVAKDADSKYLQITVEAFPDIAATDNSVKLSTIVRLNHGRNDL